jgi:hypothetical protein
MISPNKITGITATWIARSAVKLAGLNRWKQNGSKLGARDRAQLAVFAYEAGLVRPGWAG